MACLASGYSVSTQDAQPRDLHVADDQEVEVANTVPVPSPPTLMLCVCCRHVSSGCPEVTYSPLSQKRLCLGWCLFLGTGHTGFPGSCLEVKDLDVPAAVGPRNLRLKIGPCVQQNLNRGMRVLLVSPLRWLTGDTDSVSALCPPLTAVCVTLASYLPSVPLFLIQNSSILFP